MYFFLYIYVWPLAMHLIWRKTLAAKNAYYDTELNVIRLHLFFFIFFIFNLILIPDIKNIGANVKFTQTFIRLLSQKDLNVLVCTK